MKRAEDELLQNFAERPKQKFCLPITEEVYAIFQQAIAHQQTEPGLNLLWGINPNSIINDGEYSGANSLILLLSIKNATAEIIKLYEAIINYPEFNLNAKFNLKHFFKKTIFTIAAENGCAWLVTLLLSDSRVNPAADDNDAIRWAARNGHTEVVKLLLSDSRVNPASGDSCAIRWAASKGHTEVVRLLLADFRVNPAAKDDVAIRWAARNGHTEVVRLLLAVSRISPAADDNYAIRWATSRDNTEVVKLLIKNKAVNSNMDYNALGKIALDKKNNNLYATLESYNPANKGLLTVWAGRKDMGSTISILPEETIKEEIIQKIILIKKQLIAKTIS